MGNAHRVFTCTHQKSLNPKGHPCVAEKLIKDNHPSNCGWPFISTLQVWCATVEFKPLFYVPKMPKFWFLLLLDNFRVQAQIHNKCYPTSSGHWAKFAFHLYKPKVHQFKGQSSSHSLSSSLQVTWYEKVEVAHSIYF